MKTYLVGGAVRDKLINIPVKDKDWVVVGATVEKMLGLKFQQIGKDFPVFLHPKTKEEYALARTETKMGKGYTGFSVHASPEVSLEEDLMRRDLTINAIAQSQGGELIDPYHGQSDIKKKILRHVSPAFSEDPLRVLRVARFAARFSHLGFTIAPETMLLMKKMVTSHELQHLTAERIWAEIQKALSEKSPWVFFETLIDCNALLVIIPEFYSLYDLPSSSICPSETDINRDALRVLEQASRLSPLPIVRFASLIHNIARGFMKQSEYNEPNKPGNNIINAVCKRLKIPNDYRDLGILAYFNHTNCHLAEQYNPEEIYSTLLQTDALRRPERFELFLAVCEADCKAHQGHENIPYPQAGILRNALTIIQRVNSRGLIAAGYTGKELGLQLKLKRIAELQSNQSHCRGSTQ